MSELSQRNREQRELNQRLSYVKVYKDGSYNVDGTLQKPCPLYVCAKVPITRSYPILWDDCQDDELLNIYHEIKEVLEFIWNHKLFRLRGLSHDARNVNFELYDRGIHPEGEWNVNNKFNKVVHLNVDDYTVYRTEKRRFLKRSGRPSFKSIDDTGKINDSPDYKIPTTYKPEEKLRRVIRCDH